VKDLFYPLFLFIYFSCPLNKYIDVRRGGKNIIKEGKKKLENAYISACIGLEIIQPSLINEPLSIV